MRFAANFLEREAGHVVVSLLLIAIGATLWILKVPKGEDLIPFATGVLARSMIGSKPTPVAPDSTEAGSSITPPCSLPRDSV